MKEGYREILEYSRLENSKRSVKEKHRFKDFPKSPTFLERKILRIQNRLDRLEARSRS